jgi:hypothetical protein
VSSTVLGKGKSHYFTHRVSSTVLGIMGMFESLRSSGILWPVVTGYCNLECYQVFLWDYEVRLDFYTLKRWVSVAEGATHIIS